MRWKDVTNAFKHTVCQPRFRNSPDRAARYVRVIVKYTACDYWPTTRKQAVLVIVLKACCPDPIVLAAFVGWVFVECSSRLHFYFIWIFPSLLCSSQLYRHQPRRRLRFSASVAFLVPLSVVFCCLHLRLCCLLSKDPPPRPAQSRGRQLWANRSGKITSKSPCF